MTYLELCQKFVQEIGIAGGGSNNPTGVTGQNGELLNVVNWIAEANHQIDSMHRTWRYLWAEYSQALSIGDDEPTMPASPAARSWEKKSFWLDRYGTNQRHLQFVPWEAFRSRDSVPNKPQSITIKPDGQLKLDAPMTEALTLTAEYYKRPTRLAANADVPAMPEDYHRAIILYAVLIYAAREDAPELPTNYEPELEMILKNLESEQLEHREQEGDPDAYEWFEQSIPGLERQDDRYRFR